MAMSDATLKYTEGTLQLGSHRIQNRKDSSRAQTYSMQGFLLLNAFKRKHVKDSSLNPALQPFLFASFLLFVNVCVYKRNYNICKRFKCNPPSGMGLEKMDEGKSSFAQFIIHEYLEF